MNHLFDNDPTKQQARAWSAQLGSLAAQAPTQPLAVPVQLSAILEHIRQRQRQRTQDHVEHKIRANHFIMAD